MNSAQATNVAKWLGGALLLFLAAPALLFLGAVAGIAESGSSKMNWLTWPLWALAFVALSGCVYCLVRVVKGLNASR